MATSTGKMWNQGAYRRYTGHNILLDVFAGTGLLGLSLFLFGIAQIIWQSIRHLRLSSDAEDRNSAHLVLMALSYAFLMGIFGDSIVGPIDPSSVVLFILVGMGLGRIAARPVEE